MNRTFLPFYFPTNAILLDDDAGFLRHFALLLNPRLPCRLYTSVNLALQDINTQISLINQFQVFTNVSLLDEVEEQVVVDLHKVHNFLYDQNRFSQLSVVIIDYDMPAMNGLEVCKRIRHPEIKKILLTGKADEKIAVDAFNAGLIHQYIRKNVADVDMLLNRAIAKLQLEYFLDITRPIQIVMTDGIGTYLAEAGVQSAFEALLADKKYVEFYTWEQPKGLLMVDAQGHTGFVMVMSKEALQSHIEIAQSCDAPAELLRLLERQGAVPWFPTSDGYYTQDCLPDWRRHLYLTNAEMSNDKFLCAHVQPAPLANLATDRICSFDAYLKDFDSRNTTAR